MIRVDAFRMKHRPYAVDLSAVLERPGGLGFFQVRAVWFRRRRGATVACAGHLWGGMVPAPAGARELVTRLTDGRGGGECDARWDGVTLWSRPDVATPDRIAQHLELLTAALDGFPEIPQGYDGWWIF